MTFNMIAVSHALLAQAAQQRPALRSTTKASVQNTLPRRQLTANQPKNVWSHDESQCMTSDHSGSTMIQIHVRNENHRSHMTQDECARACRAKHGATACSWWNGEFEWIFGRLGFPHNEYVGECYYTTERRPLYDCANVPVNDCNDHAWSAEYCMVLDKPVINTRKTCTGADFKKKLKELQSKNTNLYKAKFFGCGRGKTKTSCPWGCKKGYTPSNGLKKSAVINARGKVVGMKSGHFATCVDGTVIHTTLPHCQKNN